MELDKIRPIAAPVAVFLLLAFAAVLLLKAWTASPSIVRVEVLTNVTSAAAQQFEDTAASEEAPVSEVNPVTAQLESYQESVFSGLLYWMGVLFAAGLLLSILWSLYAKRRERSVYGPAGQSSAMLFWWALLGALLLSFGATGFYVLVPLGLTAFITEGSLTLAAGAVALAALLGYWLATFLAASPVMRPSVPFSFTAAR